MTRTQKVMSYNIRFDNPDDLYPWRERRGKIIELIIKYKPDILGTQEVLAHQLQDLSAGLNEYRFIGVARGPDLSSNLDAPYSPDVGEFNALFFRAERLAPITSGTFWLSRTPHIPGSQLAFMTLPRIVTWATFFDRESRHIFAVFNTHFVYEEDEAGRSARAFSARLLLDKMEELAENTPKILMGDLNFTPESAADVERTYKPLTETLQDSYVTSRTRRGPDYTCPGFDIKAKSGKRIDYLMVSRTPLLTVLNYQTLDEHDGAFYPSDHLPIMGDIAFNY